MSLVSVFLFDYSVMDTLQILYFAVLSINMALSLVLILLSLRKGGAEIAVLLSGILVFYLFAGLGILFYFSHRLDMKLVFRIGWIHMGALCFVTSLVWIVAHRYFETHRQKEAAQQESLEAAIMGERLKAQMVLKQVESEKYRELDRMKSRFFANISHEVRMPLTLILGSARLVLDQSRDETCRRKLDLLMQNGRRLLHLVNELLNLSRLEPGDLANSCAAALGEASETASLQSVFSPRGGLERGGCDDSARPSLRPKLRVLMLFQNS